MNSLMIDPVADLDLAREFMRNPLGRHSPNLARLMRFMRSHETVAEKPCVLALEPNRRWALIRLGGPRHDPVVPLGPVFTDLLDAERAVFRLRWKNATGQELELESQP